MVAAPVYEKFFDEYQKLRQEHNFKPEMIFNIDETMIEVGKDRKKAVVFKDESIPVSSDGVKMEHLTLLLTLPQKESSVMKKIRPLLIFSRKTYPDLDDDISNYFDISGNSSGWINGEILKNWLENQFLQQIYERRQIVGPMSPVLVILDNHSSREFIDKETMWNEHRIMFLFIPPHTSHVIQPLDLCPNGTFKQQLNQHFKGIKGEPCDLRRNRILLASIISLETALSASYRVTAWRKSGLFPFAPEKILQDGKVAKQLNDENHFQPRPRKRKMVKFNGGVATKGEKVVIQIVKV